MNHWIRFAGFGFVLLVLGVVAAAAESPAEQSVPAESAASESRERELAKEEPAKVEKSASAEAAKKEKTPAKTEKWAGRPPRNTQERGRSQEGRDRQKGRCQEKKRAKKTRNRRRRRRGRRVAASHRNRQKTPFKVTVSWKAFEGEEAHEVAVPTEEWTTLVVRNAIAHGAVMRKGDILLELETDKLDHAIADLRTELKIADLSLHENELQVQATEKIAALELDAGRHGAAEAEEDQKFYNDILRPLALKTTDFELKMAREALEYEQEELRQLEKMYKADDITEETEEIVLRRARDTVERAKFAAEMAQVSRDYTVQYLVPRKDAEVKETTQRKLVEWEHAKAEIPLTLQHQHLELEKLQAAKTPSDEKMKHLLADRQYMTIRSPADGIVYYGKFSRGKPADASALADLLRRGTIAAEQTIMTVIAKRPTCVRVAIAENQLRDLRPGVRGIAVPVAYPDVDLPVTIDRVGDIPMSPGSFDGRLTVVLPEKAKWLAPGLTCKITLVPYLKKDALCLPPKVLVPDELDSRKQYVMVLDKDGKPVKQAVTVGRQTDKLVEILKGLNEGDKVVADPSK